MSGQEPEGAQIRQPRQTVSLIEAECWQLLASVPVGRVVFTQHVVPSIRVVNHLINGSTIIIRSHLGSAITGHAADDGAIVCYETDELNPARRTGWSVMATGPARLVADSGAAARYPATARAVGRRADGPRHRHHARDHHRDPPGRLVLLTMDHHRKPAGRTRPSTRLACARLRVQAKPTR